jgi:ribonuclease Z
LRERGLKVGPWLGDLKSAFIAQDFERTIDVDVSGGHRKSYKISQLSPWLLLPRHRHKIAYVTDGAANAHNFCLLKALIQNSDILFAETCFMNKDQDLADETMHFTTSYIGRLAREAGVKSLAPFHFSKRYQEGREAVISEIQDGFQGDVILLETPL